MGKPTEPTDAKPEATPQTESPQTVSPLLDTVRDPKPIGDAEALDDKGEPEGDNFA